VLSKNINVFVYNIYVRYQGVCNVSDEEEKRRKREKGSMQKTEDDNGGKGIYNQRIYRTKSKRDGTKPIWPDLEHCHTDNVLLGVLNSLHLV